MTRFSFLITILSLTASSASLAQTPNPGKSHITSKFDEAVTRVMEGCDVAGREGFAACVSGPRTVWTQEKYLGEPVGEESPDKLILWAQFKKCLAKHCPSVKD